MPGCSVSYFHHPHAHDDASADDDDAANAAPGKRDDNIYRNAVVKNTAER